MSSAQVDNYTPVEESLSFLVRPETIKELIEAASGRRRSSQESIRSLKKNIPWFFPLNSRLQPEKVNKGGGQPWQNESQLVFEVGREGEQARGETDDQINGD